jgi:hypothetical protein
VKFDGYRVQAHKWARMGTRRIASAERHALIDNMIDRVTVRSVQ